MKMPLESRGILAAEIQGSGGVVGNQKNMPLPLKSIFPQSISALSPSLNKDH